MGKKKYKKRKNQYRTGTNRKYKDTLFRMVFREKKDLLELYNAINGTEYRDMDALEVNTLEDVVYLSFKNDLSFLIAGTMNLYEHQSSYNPNMPIRGLIYFARLYERYVEKEEIDIYGSMQKELPPPRYLVFYNGKKEEKDETELRLSDAFQKGKGEKTPCLECVATMLNINYGHNRRLMEKCRRLEEYSIFVFRVRENMKRNMGLRDAIDQAVDECAREGILADILIGQRTEVVSMILHMTQEEHEKLVRKEERKEGRLEGRIEGKIFLIQAKWKKDKPLEVIAEELEEEVENIRDLYELVTRYPERTSEELCRMIDRKK